MDINVIDQYFLTQPIANQEVLLTLRDFILKQDSQFSEHWKYKLPFYYFKGKPFCYFHYNKRNGNPYIGLVRALNVQHPLLEQGNRKKMKVLEIDPTQDIPLDSILEIFEDLKLLY